MPPGTKSILTEPSPDPIPYVASPGATISSSQENTNKWTVTNFLNTTLVPFLNSCNFLPMTALTGVNPTSPILASVTPCAAGGSTLNLSLNTVPVTLFPHGDYLDLSSAQTAGGAKSFSSAITDTSNSGFIASRSSSSVQGSALQMYDGSSVEWQMYSPASSEDFRLWNSVFGDAFIVTQANPPVFTMKGNLTATNFFTGSRRAWKKDIISYPFDPMAVLEGTDFAEYTCKDSRCGVPGTRRDGIIADDSPAQVSGPKHDHYDAFAMAAIDGAAIVELKHQVDLMELAGGVGLLVGLLQVLFLVLYRRA